MLTLAMPQSEPAAETKRSASRRSRGEDRGGQALAPTSFWSGDGLVEFGVAHDVEDRGEGLALHDVGLGGHLDQRRADVERVGTADADPLAAGHHPAVAARLVEGGLHRLVGGAVDQRTDQHARLARVADA